jgi:hypothetical protein
MMATALVRVVNVDDERDDDPIFHDRFRWLFERPVLRASARSVETAMGSATAIISDAAVTAAVIRYRLRHATTIPRLFQFACFADPVSPSPSHVVTVFTYPNSDTAVLADSKYCVWRYREYEVAAASKHAILAHRPQTALGADLNTLCLCADMFQAKHEYLLIYWPDEDDDDGENEKTR